MVAAITGANLGDPTYFRNCTNSYPIPTTCFGISVLVNGTAAPVMSNSATEIIFQVPFSVGGSSATIQVTSNLSGATVSSAAVTVPVAAVAPGMFSTNGTGVGTAYYSAADGLFSEVSPPVQVGQTVTMYGTGFGVTNPAVAAGSLGPNTPAGAVATATATIANQSVPVTFAGLQPGNLSGATAGYDELVFTVPSGLVIPSNQTQASFPVVVTVGGVASNPVNVIVAVPQATITSLSPNPVPPAASPQTVIVNGSGFQNGTGLTVVLASSNGQVKLTAPNVTFVSANQLSVQMTVGTAGTWSVAVDNPDGGVSNTFVFTAATGGPPPAITSVVTTWGNAASQTPQISQNAWIEVHGSNLSQVTTTWSTLPASAFATSLPTNLGGVTATVDGKPAAVSYVSPTQVNILAPLDSATGTVPVQLDTPNGQTPIMPVTEVQTTPAFLFLEAGGHVAAQHLDYSLLGPAAFSSPGYTFTPAKPGETVIVYGTGFGQTNPPITDQLKGSGPLPSLPSVTVGGTPAVVVFAGLSGSGLYQLTFTVPAGTPDGDASLLALYNGSSTQSSAVIAVHH
jgi:uncharacterized protein (TIGR03437 family)